jgi:CheY-like chemotaxis protein
MNLQSLVVADDEKTVRVLRRVLCDLEIDMEHCTDPDSAVQQLTRNRFEAVIVDCTDEELAGRVLKSARLAPCNKRAVALAIVDANMPLRSAFQMGAHFVLYKPISAERAKTSFRAARALMKRERRRNARIPVEMPVTVRVNDGQSPAVSLDLGEGGLAVKFAQRPQNLNSISVHFALPGTTHTIECIGEVAWENSNRQVGIRFVDLLPDSRDELKSWLESHSPDFEKDDPPTSCKLAEFSLGGCYLESVSPFPVRTRVILSHQIAGLRLQVEGVVRLMHPDMGMGVEFTKRTPQQKEHVKKFLRAFTNLNLDAKKPELLVEPEGLDTDEPVSPPPSASEGSDQLLRFFAAKADLPPKAFMVELRSQRHSKSSTALASQS